MFVRVGGWECIIIILLVLLLFIGMAISVRLRRE
jgi:uncharacterized membrane protein YqaE (UPF0057 family)